MRRDSSIGVPEWQDASNLEIPYDSICIPGTDTRQFWRSCESPNHWECQYPIYSTQFLFWVVWRLGSVDQIHLFCSTAGIINLNWAKHATASTAGLHVTNCGCLLTEVSSSRSVAYHFSSSPWSSVTWLNLLNHAASIYMWCIAYSTQPLWSRSFTGGHRLNIPS